MTAPENLSDDQFKVKVKQDGTVYVGKKSVGKVLDRGPYEHRWMSKNRNGQTVNHFKKGDAVAHLTKNWLPQS